LKIGLVCVGLWALAWTSPAFCGESTDAASGLKGALIYEKTCAECHGKQGEGVHGKHDEILAGNRTLTSLTRLISKTMPEGKEGSCVGPDADAVAKYIFDAFYSPAAQARVRPVQESLSRVTVSQFRNSVADLLGRFRPGFDRPMGNEHGLRGVYSGFAIPTPEEEAEGSLASVWFTRQAAHRQEEE
jgi:mono/diheme cytochrome c family protein